MSKQIFLAGVCALLVYPQLSVGESTSMIAFASNRDHWNGSKEIYVINPDGTGEQRLTFLPGQPAGEGSNTHPAWSPDGKIAWREGSTGILLMDPDGTNQVALSSILLMDPDGTNQVALIRHIHSNEPHDVYPILPAFPSWSPDGTRFVFSYGVDRNTRHIYTINIDGTDPVQLTNHLNIRDFSPQWSPDGTQIAFYSNRDGNIPKEDWNYEIYVIDADGSNVIRLTHSPGRDMGPEWSPDGRQIAFTSSRDGNGEIYVMDADGRNQVNLTQHPETDNSPTWSPDGRYIAFVSWSGRDGDRHAYTDIYVMKADGTNQVRITQNPGDDGFPAWSPWIEVETLIKDMSWGQIKREH